jgi:murein DD-endopeptidase MepM/ murein hydrolase activator NlpD
MRVKPYKKYLIVFGVSVAFLLTIFSIFLLSISASKKDTLSYKNSFSLDSTVDTLISNFSKLPRKSTFDFENLNDKEKNFIIELLPSGMPSASSRVTSAFGYRVHPIFKDRRFHSGIDFGGTMGIPIRATADGFVEFAGENGGYGNFVLLDHEFGFKSAYGHMKSNLKVKSGSYVKKGDIIGYLGNSGRSTGPHLHYEVKYGQKALDPLGFINLNSHNFEQFISCEREIDWGVMVTFLSRIQNKFLLLSKK